MCAVALSGNAGGKLPGSSCQVLQKPFKVSDLLAAVDDGADDGVDEDEVGAVEGRVWIVVDAEGRTRHEALGTHDDGARPERSHVQPDRCRARAAVVQE